MNDPAAPNLLARIARKHGRDYVTPEDVGLALRSHSLAAVRRAALQVLGKMAGVGWENAVDVAYAAFKGRRPPYYKRGSR